MKLMHRVKNTPSLCQGKK